MQGMRAWFSMPRRFRVATFMPSWLIIRYGSSLLQAYAEFHGTFHLHFYLYQLFVPAVHRRIDPGAPLCRKCNKGFYCPGMGFENPCPNGTYAETGMIKCIPCSPGHYCNAKTLDVPPKKQETPEGVYTTFGLVNKPHNQLFTKLILAYLKVPIFVHFLINPAVSQTGYVPDMITDPCPLGHFCPKVSSLLKHAIFSSGHAEPRAL